MPTGQAIVNGALTALGILEQGGTPSVSDSNDSLSELNIMWDDWGIDEGLIYAQQYVRFPFAASVGVYTIGPGAYANFPRPSRIYAANAVQSVGGAISSTSLGAGGLGYAVNDTGIILGADGTVATYVVNTIGPKGAVVTFSVTAAGTGYLAGYGYQTQTGGAQPGAGTGFTVNILTVTAFGQNRNPLRIIEATEYYAHNDLGALAATPDELYPEFQPDANGFSRLYPWPVPTVLSALTCELETGVNFSTWTLTGNYVVPAGYQDAIQYALAYRLLPRFGVAVAPQVAQFVTALAAKAEARIRAANTSNRKLPEGSAQAPGQAEAMQAAQAQGRP